MLLMSVAGARYTAIGHLDYFASLLGLLCVFAVNILSWYRTPAGRHTKS